METIKRWWNFLRIQWHLKVTGRAQKITVKGDDGKQYNAVVEKHLEKVCDHKQIHEIAPTMWKCSKCDDAYFQISYKVMLGESDLVGFLDKIATHLKEQGHENV